MILVPSFFPPSKICPGALLHRTSCPSPLSFRPFSSSLPITRIQLPPSSVWSPPLSVPHRPSARELPTLRLRPTNVLSLFPEPASHMQACTPPTDLYGWWYLAWVWVCVEGRKETAPRGGRESVVPPAGITGQTAKCMPPW